MSGLGKRRCFSRLGLPAELCWVRPVGLRRMADFPPWFWSGLAAGSGCGLCCVVPRAAGLLCSALRARCPSLARVAAGWVRDVPVLPAHRGKGLEGRMCRKATRAVRFGVKQGKQLVKIHGCVNALSQV